MDGKHVVFGRVVEGQSIVDDMQAAETGEQDLPVKEIKVEDCGELPREESKE